MMEQEQQLPQQEPHRLVDESEVTLNYDSKYSDNLPAILQALNITIMATSYDASSLILVRSIAGKINTQLEFFPRPMGLYVDENTFSLGTLNRVLNFKRTDFFLPEIKNGYYDNMQAFSRKMQENRPDRVAEYKQKRDEKIAELKQADALYSERASLTTGRINIHDIAWGNDRLWILNTAFSSLCSLDPDYNFIAHWKPPFISELRPEDRCHLNGLAMLDGEPRFVTTCGQEDVKEDWYLREANGTVIDIETNEILASGLYMPHSPRVHGEHLFFCESGLACIKRINLTTREIEVFAEIPSFCRGMHIYGEIMIVGVSAIRSSENKNALPIRDMIKEEDSFCGIWLLDVNSGEKIAELVFTGDVKQIYDVAVVPNGHAAAITTSTDVLNQHLFDYMEQ